MDEVLPVLRREQVGECFGEAVMDIDDFVQPFRNRGWREPQAQVPQDDSVDDGRVRMERRVELAGEGRFDPAGSDESSSSVWEKSKPLLLALAMSAK